MIHASQRGFTLIELVVAISISAIVVGFMAMFLVTPVESYLAQTRRAELVVAADMTTNNMLTDLRLAPVGSVRYVRNGSAEVLEINTATPVAYICDPAARIVRRYSNYPPAANLSARDSDAELMGAGGGVSRALIARDVLACQISYDAINPLHNRLVGLRMQLTRAGETMVVFRQMAVGS